MATVEHYPTGEFCQIALGLWKKSTAIENNLLTINSATNVFWRQIRNLKIDLTAIPQSSSVSHSYTRPL